MEMLYIEERGVNGDLGIKLFMSMKRRGGC